MSDITSPSARQRVTQLRDDIRRHEHLYYVLNEPEVSDAEFDALMKELRQLEKEYPALAAPDSPSQRVGGEPREGVTKTTHSSVMLSLSNAFDDADLRDFDRRARELAEVDTLDYVGELKLDGVSMAVRYADGRLDLALTRGDGEFGEVITPNARTLRTVPLSIPPSDVIAAGIPEEFEVRGEVVMPKAAFAYLNEEQHAAGRPLFANARNAAAGSLRMLDPTITLSRHLDFHAYLLLADGKAVFDFHWESLDALSELGFKVDSHRERLRGTDDLAVYRDRWLQQRDSLPYEIDGVVFQGRRGRFAAAVWGPRRRRHAGQSLASQLHSRRRRLSRVSMFRSEELARSRPVPSYDRSRSAGSPCHGRHSTTRGRSGASDSRSATACSSSGAVTLFRKSCG